MSGEQPSVHPDWLLPPPKSGLSGTARILVGFGIAGGLVTLTTCAALIMGLIQREPIADVAPPLPPEMLAAAGETPDNGHNGSTVLEPSGDRSANAPEDLRPAAVPPGTTAKDRTQVVLNVQLVQMDPSVEKVAGDAGFRLSLAEGTKLLSALAGPGPDGTSVSVNDVTPEDVAAVLGALEARGAARVLTASKIETFDRLPAVFVQEAKSRPAGTAASPTPETATIDVFPEVLDGGKVRLELFAEFSSPAREGSPVAGTRKINTTVEVRSGQFLVLGGLAGDKTGRSVVVLAAHVRPPQGPLAPKPLSKVEINDRCRHQCRFLQDELARNFPESQVTLVADSGRLLVKGKAVDGVDAEAIMAAVRRRARQWRVLEGLAPAGADDASVVAMIDTPPPTQVVVRMKFFELDRAAAIRAARNTEAISPSDQALLAMLLRLNDPRHSTVLEGLSAPKLEAAMKTLQRLRLVRVLSEPTLATVSRRKATLTSGSKISLSSDSSAASVTGDKPQSYTYGTIIEALPVVLKDGRLRVEVKPDFRTVVEDNRASNPPRLVLASRAVTAVAVMRSGQTLAVAGLPGQPTPGQRGTSPPQQFLLVTAEVVPPTQAVPLVASDAPKPAKRQSPRPRDPGARQADYVESVDKGKPTPPQATAASAAIPAAVEPAVREAASLAAIIRDGRLHLEVGQNREVADESKIRRATSVDPKICEVSQAREGRITVTARSPGDTYVRVWFEDPRDAVSVRVRVLNEAQAEQARQDKVRVLQEVVTELFPKCKLKLALAGDKLAVEGIAQDAAEARLILSVVQDATADTPASSSSLRLIDRIRRISASTPEQAAAPAAAGEPDVVGVAAAVSPAIEPDAPTAKTPRASTPLPIRATPATGPATPLPIGAVAPAARPAPPTPLRPIPAASPEPRANAGGLSSLVDRLRAVKMPFEKQPLKVGSETPAGQ